ncbi:MULTISPECIES: ferredoxin [Actinokineospora]|uniref:Ferredoxin n=1 Tax=Actinokineospora fastidiosa TaxID=1816 RepID=A0A918GF49_9PSEU|nr:MULTISPECIES: ferredoxin [Actinokineospora]UVS80020.1 Ferredoxin-1 [Actinokineospora sp. UTMC 2448]GGS32534.1 ferredoxin [Actinokineospora fastidiosa]
MTVRADTSVCIGAGLCALRAPKVFDQDESDGTVVLLGQPGADDLPAVREAVDQCPSGAIELSGD